MDIRLLFQNLYIRKSHLKPINTEITTTSFKSHIKLIIPELSSKEERKQLSKRRTSVTTSKHHTKLLKRSLLGRSVEEKFNAYSSISIWLLMALRIPISYITPETVSFHKLSDELTNHITESNLR